MYSALFGNYDDLKAVDVSYAKNSIVVLTDQIKDGLNVEQIQVSTEDVYRVLDLLKISHQQIKLTNQTFNRIIKIYPFYFFPNAECVVYIDSHINVIGDIQALIARFMGSKADWLGIPHRYSTSLYDEAKACYVNGKISKSEFHNYIKKGLQVFQNTQMFECGVLIRKNNKNVHKTSAKWLEYYINGPRRDQLHLLNALKAEPLILDILEDDFNNSKIFKVGAHQKTKLRLMTGRLIKIIRLIELRLIYGKFY